MSEQFGDKQHDATPFRRQKAREEGQVARSNDLASAIMLLAGLLALMWAGGHVAEFLGTFAIGQLSNPQIFHADEHLALSVWAHLATGIAKSMLPVFVILIVVALVANIGQTGFLFLPNKLSPNVDHINPLKGLQRLFSMNSAMRLTFGVFKIVIVACVGIGSLYFRQQEILAASQLQIGQLALFIADIVFWTVLYVGIALLILAILDYAYQRWKFEQDIRMTTQEMREEMKSLQGDPQVIARRRQVQRQLALNRMGQDIPTADVVLTNPTELAIAIRYDFATMAAPLVIAKGAGLVAQRIRRLALENDVPIVERKELARFLYKNVEVNQPVPMEQYAAVAEVLKYVYELKGKSLPNAA